MAAPIRRTDITEGLTEKGLYWSGATLLGALIGFLIFIYVCVVFFTLGSIPGFTFLASVITIFSGVQLFSLGLIGEYLARVFERSSGRPRYAIQARLGGGA